MRFLSGFNSVLVLITLSPLLATHLPAFSLEKIM